MHFLGLETVAWVIAVSVVVVGAILQGSMGFGLGLVTAPILVLLDPELVPGVIIGTGVPLALLIAWRERKALDAKLVRWAIVGRFPGSIAGSLAVVALGTRSLAIAFALSILLAVVVSIAGVSVRRTNSTMLTAGFLSGLSGTATSVGGPPMALVMQHSTGPELRAALATFMAFGSVFSLTMLIIVGEFAERELGITAVLVPAAALGFAVSARTNAVLDRGHTRTAVLTVAAVSAVAILVRSL